MCWCQQWPQRPWLEGRQRCYSYQPGPNSNILTGPNKLWAAWLLLQQLTPEALCC